MPNLSIPQIEEIAAKKVRTSPGPENVSGGCMGMCDEIDSLCGTAISALRELATLRAAVEKAEHAPGCASRLPDLSPSDERSWICLQSFKAGDEGLTEHGNREYLRLSTLAKTTRKLCDCWKSAIGVTA